MKEEKITVTLDNPCGIIIPAETGYIFQNQCDGVGCRQGRQEGIYLPLGEGILPRVVFDPDRFYLGDARISEIVAAWEDYFKALQAQHEARDSPRLYKPPVKNMKLIQHKDNTEAWLHVELEARLEYGDKYQPLKGILVWENCD